MGETGSAARIENERLFHNARFAAEEDPRGHLDRAYGVIGEMFIAQEEMVRRRGAGRDVLEYGCSDGSHALRHLKVPGFARRFHGIDISDAGIEKARAQAAALGCANAAFDQMNAEAMAFPDGSFDVVYGRGIIHHLDLEAAYSEIARVLRPGGVALFAEPLGHNPLINWYRRRTPALRTPDEHPLLMPDIALARRHFARVEPHFYGLSVLAAVPLVGTALDPAAVRLLQRVDRLLFRLPPLRRHAWFALLQLEK